MKIRIQLGLAFLFSLTTWGQAAPAESPRITPDQAAILRSGDAAKLRDALDHGLSPNARDEQGNTPLIEAAIYGDLASMRLLVEQGAEVNATNRARATALLRAADDADKVALLLDHGANVNGHSVLGNTPLMLAARTADSRRAVELLLSHGADVHATNNWGATALMAAAAGGDAQSVKLLLEHGADANAQPGADHGAFVLGGGRSALMWAAFRGDLPILKLLLEAGANPNTANFLGTPLAQAAWADHTEAAKLLLEHGAKIDQAGPIDGYSALHWAASTEQNDPALVKLLLDRGAAPDQGGGENVEAFVGTVQTPLMLAQRRGNKAVLAALVKAGASKATPERIAKVVPPDRALPEHLDSEPIRTAIAQAVPALQETSIESKKAYLRHGSHQDCVSCHQQFLPMAAIGFARKQHVPVDLQAEQQLIQMVSLGELKGSEADWEALFHPEPAHTKGYALFAMAAEDQQGSPTTDAWVHHLTVIQGKEGQWYNNMPRPPIQSGDIAPTALAVRALQYYPIPGRKAELARRVDRARQWLWKAHADNTDGQIYQILGLAWAGEPSSHLEALAKALLAEQRPDGGWAQLPNLASDPYATAQAVYALRVGSGLASSHAAVQQGVRYLLRNQLQDGTWYVHRRAFPFQPTMDSGFPHGRDSWISAAASSWAVLALSVAQEPKSLALQP